MKRMDIHGVAGPMRVILLDAGEDNPNFPAATEPNKAIVEFYDGRYQHTPDGQFVSRYYADTLLEKRHPTQGLDLMGYEESWKIDGRTYGLVRNWIEYHTYQVPA